MSEKIVGLFPDEKKGEKAVTWLKKHGVRLRQIEVISGHSLQAEGQDGGSWKGASGTDGAMMGVVAGTGLASAGGALLGIAASIGPGVGLTASDSTSGTTIGAVGGVLAASAVVGSSLAGIGRSLDGWGLDAGEAQMVQGFLSDPATLFVGAELAGSSIDGKQAAKAIKRLGGKPILHD
ncbi:MAG: hypothetical protein IT209_07715 [Armatimonadetes bacterium]|nr:hypothetical protein [Armatimonadota bacterium]